MHRSIMIAGLVVIGWCFLAQGEGGCAESQKTDGRKGITVEDLGRGVKSAAQNLEQEVPKIGPAIGATFKKVTGMKSEKQPAHSPDKKN